MAKETVGVRTRPRAALVGKFRDTDEVRFKKLFPTIWASQTFEELYNQVDYREVDVVIVESEVTSDNYTAPYLKNCYLISFSARIGLSRYLDKFFYLRSELSTTEQYQIPSLPLPFYRLIENDFENIHSTRGWSTFYLTASHQDHKERTDEANETFRSNALVLDYHTSNPLAVIYQPYSYKYPYALLPNEAFSRYEWVETITQHWAETDKVCFPNFGDWTKLPEWMMPEEEILSDQIIGLEQKKLEVVREYNQQIKILKQQLSKATLRANESRRRLLTSQGNELVDEVASLFKDVGFIVEDVDEILDSNLPKREDLRLRLPDENNAWEAIVEVRGYSKGGGKTSDFQRLSRFEKLYNQEKGKYPNRKIYIVNGQFEIPNPSQRQESPSEEDVNEFAKDNGLVISTTELFKLAKKIDSYEHSHIRKSISEGIGRWRVNLLETSR